MSLVTVLTPTYNRVHTLPNLYKSLCIQSNKDFEWLIVDDGSIDKTEELCKSFMEEAPFTVQYIKKVNGGKHTALNVGIKKIASPLTIIVDSDDQLTSNAIEIIYLYYNKYKKNQDIGCFSFLRCYENGKAIVGLEKNEFIDSYIKYRIKQEHAGDMAEVFFTDILKQHLFPEFIGERFLSEDVVWIEIGKKYKYCFINKPIYICEYLKDGLTANDKPMKFASPLGSMLRGKQLMLKECGLKVNIKGAIIYNCYKNKKISNLPDRLKTQNFREKFLIFITILPGRIYRCIWMRKGKYNG